MWDDFCVFLIFPVPREKIVPDGPKRGKMDFFPTDPDLAEILGDTDLNFEDFYVRDDFSGQDFLFSRFPEILSNFPKIIENPL